MVENLRIAFWVYKKDESRKIRIETLCAFVVELDSLFHKKDESRKIRIETPKTSKSCIFSPFIRKMNPGK